MNAPRAGWVDALQFSNWSREGFELMRAAGLSAVHATVAYHESFRPTVARLIAWNWRFRDHADLILPGRTAADLMKALSTGRTAIILGLQNPLPIEDDLGLVTILHELGIRVMQLTYNNQSLLGCGWQEVEDSGLTRMGHEVIAEMNGLGMLIDLSHAGERTALEAIEASKRPVAITHATPDTWRAGRRQVSETVMRALAQSGGILGLSTYPHHLRDGSATTLESFCEMAARAAEVMGVGHLGIGSDLCLDQPDEMLTWMREGNWMRPNPSEARPTFPRRPSWFQDSRGFADLAAGLRAAGFGASDVEAILGANWQRFFRASFRPGWDRD